MPVASCPTMLMFALHSVAAADLPTPPMMGSGAAVNNGVTSLAKNNRCYALRYADLFSGYCKGNLSECSWEGLEVHWKGHGKAEGRVRSCTAPDIECYASSHPELLQRVCQSSDVKACTHTHHVLLLEHFAVKGSAEGHTLDCSPPLPPQSHPPPPQQLASPPPPASTLVVANIAGPDAHDLPKTDKSKLRCYALRYPDLMSGFCKNDLGQCNWSELDAHWKSAGVKERRILGCLEADAKCYAERYPELMNSYCGGDLSTCRHDNFIALLEHFALIGLKEGRKFHCVDQSSTHHG